MSSLHVEPLTVPTQHDYNGTPFPLILECRNESPTLEQTAAWISANREQLDQQASQHGAVLFRGFPVASAEDFDAFIVPFEYENFRYLESLSNAVRVNKTERVFTANEAPPSVNIYLHHEMAQTPIYPSKLFFFCEHAAETGGATPLCHSAELIKLMEQELPEFTSNCEEQGLKYTTIMPGVDDPQSGMGRSWQSTFRAADRDEAEARMTKLNYSWEWLDNDCLRATTPILQAVRDLGHGRKSFFNQLIAAFRGWKDERNDPSKAITFGDGTPMNSEVVMQVAELAERVTFDIPWQSGDVALVDNYVAMHGRRSFTGTRKVLASLVAGEGC